MPYLRHTSSRVQQCRAQIEMCVDRCYINRCVSASIAIRNGLYFLTNCLYLTWVLSVRNLCYVWYSYFSMRKIYRSRFILLLCHFIVSGVSSLWILVWLPTLGLYRLDLAWTFSVSIGNLDIAEYGLLYNRYNSLCMLILPWTMKIQWAKLTISFYYSLKARRCS